MRLPQPLVQSMPTRPRPAATIRSICLSPAMQIGSWKRCWPACPTRFSRTANSFAIAIARSQSEAALRTTLGPYSKVADALLTRVAPGRHPWVRDVTVSNSTFGNRYVRVAAPHLGVHALGGGIGQGIAMAIGAAMVDQPAKTIALIGDGGSQLMIGELATAVEMQANVAFVLMNDQGYGVIRNIQDAHMRAIPANEATGT